MDKEKLSNTRLDFIERRIDELKSYDVTNVDIEYVKSLLLNLFRAYICFPVRISEGRPIFRARRHREEEKGQFLKHVREIYPDPKFVKKLGRANGKGEAIFYFSADPIIAMRELSPQSGDEFSIIECIPRDDTSCLLAPIGIREMAYKHKARIGGELPEPVERLEALLAGDSESLNKWQLIDNFIAEEYLKIVKDGAEYLYKTTIAMSEMFFTFGTDDEFMGGITYPSLASNKINANMAFRPEFFNRTYRAVGCTWQRIDGELEEMGYRLDRYDALSVKEDGTIVWPIPRPYESDKWIVS